MTERERSLFLKEGVLFVYYIYIMTNQINTVLYTGVTNNLERRVYEHKNCLIKGFSSKYKTHKLVYFSSTTDVKEAISFEKRIKGWTRIKKEALINSINPQWNDLSDGWYGE